MLLDPVSCLATCNRNPFSTTRQKLQYHPAHTYTHTQLSCPLSCSSSHSRVGVCSLSLATSNSVDFQPSSSTTINQEVPPPFWANTQFAAYSFSYRLTHTLTLPNPWSLSPAIGRSIERSIAPRCHRHSYRTTLRDRVLYPKQPHRSHLIATRKCPQAYSIYPITSSRHTTCSKMTRTLHG